MTDICFLVLHYKCISETINCVESIKKISERYSHCIVIVDNGSGNDTGDELLSRYSKDQSVTVIISQDNLGFSRGNNLGYRYAKATHDPRFLVVTNNDIVFNQAEFIRHMMIAYKDTGFYVCGPDIYTASYCRHENPYDGIDSLNAIQKRLHLLGMYQRFMILYALRTRMARLKNAFRERLLGLKRRRHINDTSTRTVTGLHGSCLVFSEKFISSEDAAFWPETFLYGEEDILCIRCNRRGYSMVYNPNMQVYHGGAQSSKKRGRVRIAGYRSRVGHMIDSLNVIADKWNEI